MLELRPSCEHCQVALPPDSNEAMICSFECTFCRDCVEGILELICPNCGGNFTKRPVRPSRDLKNGNCLGKFPASQKVVHKVVDLKAHKELIAKVKGLMSSK